MRDHSAIANSLTRLLRWESETGIEPMPCGRFRRSFSPYRLVDALWNYLCSESVSGTGAVVGGVVEGVDDGAGVVVGAGGVGSEGRSSVVGLDGGVAGVVTFSSFESQAARPKVAARSMA